MLRRPRHCAHEVEKLRHSAEGIAVLCSAVERELIGGQAVDHLGIAGEGKPSLEEYARPGHVDAGLLDDIAQWVKQQQ